jgi:hypothetical protein
MRKCIVFVLPLLLCGCGESTESMRNRATSQVNVIGDKLSEKIGEDGWFVRVNDVDEVDPWDKKITVKYERQGIRETLTVRSGGQDGLPFTKDDIAVRFHLDSDVAREARGKEWQKSVEGFGRAVTKGLTKGVVDTVKETLSK